MANLQLNNPIGIFDSGIGGLTVAHAINKLLPKENIVYFGDTAHLPYGDKSAEAIRQYATRISDFLLSKKCKTIVIACNTASSVAFNTTSKHVKGRAYMFNVIDPIVNYVAREYPKSKIGVIGTKGTINSRVYVRKINKLSAKTKVVSMATPLLAPMIEEGFFNNYISRTIIHSYLSKKAFNHVNAIVLGCTHYPLIKKEVQEYYGPGVEVIDSAQVVAQFVKQKLTASGLLSKRTSKPRHQFFVSDYTEAFEHSTKIFFKDELHLKKVRIWH